MNDSQSLLHLSHLVVREQPHSLVCIPDRPSAEYELDRIRREYRDRLIRATIRKDRKGSDSTYTVRYFTRETEFVRLF